MILIKLIFASLVTPGLLSSALAAETATEMTLQQAVSEADVASPQIQKARSAQEEAVWKKVESYSGFLPTLTASGTYLTNKRYLLTDINFGGAPTSVPQILPTTNYVLNAQWSLFDGFASTNILRAATSFERAAKANLDWTKFTVNREITLQYYRALGAKQLKQVSEQNIRTLEDHARDVGLFKKAGVSTNFDVLRVDVQVSEARSELLNATDNAETSRNRLGEILGAESEIREPVGKLPVLDTGIIKGLSNDTILERSDLQALQDRAQAFGYQESASSRYLVPRLSAFGQYQYYNNINDQIHDREAFREAYQVGLMLTWNLFDGLTSVARSKESAEQRFQSEKTLQQARVKAKYDFEFWKRKYVYFCSVYKSRLNDVQKSTESVRLAREGHRVGARTNTDLLDAEAELFRAQAGVVNSQVGAIEALINLELTLGKKLYDFN